MTEATTTLTCAECNPWFTFEQLSDSRDTGRLPRPCSGSCKPRSGCHGGWQGKVGAGGTARRPESKWIPKSWLAMPPRPCSEAPRALHEELAKTPRLKELHPMQRPYLPRSAGQFQTQQRRRQTERRYVVAEARTRLARKFCAVQMDLGLYLQVASYP